VIIWLKAYKQSSADLLTRFINPLVGQERCNKETPRDRAFMATPLLKYTHTQDTLKFTTPLIKGTVSPYKLMGC